jgi:hypothetical protein
MTESWVQICSLFVANAGLILWFRAESRADHRQCIDLVIAIQNEMKDFHGRLCKIEEARLGK